LQSGAKNRRSSAPGKIGRICCHINFQVSSRTAKTVRDLTVETGGVLVISVINQLV
jgi:hypothetical protein